MPTTSVRPAPTPVAVTLVVRLVGAAALGLTAAIHLDLWLDGYRDIRWIGPLFLLTAVGSVVLGLAVLLAPPRRLAWACGLGALLELGTLGGLLLSVTVGFLGFFESWQAPWAHSSVVVEAVGGAVMGGFAVAHAVRSAQASRSRQRRARV